MLCASFNVSLLTVFGSVLRLTGAPNDLDVAVRFAGEQSDLLGFLDALMVLTEADHLDLMDLAMAGPVARERALVGAVVLFESIPGLFARANVAAMMERMDTDWLRRLDLKLMARDL